jgi:hypothetical protein
MLTEQQKQNILEGFSLGFSDHALERMLGIKSMTIFKFRKAQGIASKSVTANRYAMWIKLIDEGKTLEDIGKIYNADPHSIRQTLYVNGISINAVRKGAAKEAIEQILETA